MRLPIYYMLAALVAFLSGRELFAAEKRPIDVIEDNSFLIEEAYNQEPGVVQHIFNAVYSADSRARGWAFSFTQEWPVFSQDHQFSFTIPSFHLRGGGERVSGVGDILLNYRYQLLEEGDMKPAFAPRPSGDKDRESFSEIRLRPLPVPAVSLRLTSAAYMGAG